MIGRRPMPDLKPITGDHGYRGKLYAYSVEAAGPGKYLVRVWTAPVSTGKWSEYHREAIFFNPNLGLWYHHKHFADSPTPEGSAKLLANEIYRKAPVGH